MRLLALLLICGLVVNLYATPVSTNAGGLLKWGLATPNAPADAAAIATISTNAVQAGENSNWVSVLLTNQSLFAWGSDTFGQVSQLPSGNIWRYVFPGWRHGIAINTNGVVREWGTPYGHALADWTNTMPSAVATANIIQVAAGDDHSLALADDGTVYAWGGRRLVTNHNATITDATMIDSAWYAWIALRDVSGSNVVTFGTTSISGQYITVPAGLTNATFVGAGQFSFVAIDDQKRPWAWGMPDDYGQFTFDEQATNIVSISAGTRHTIMARGDGTVLCYGDNSLGQCNIPAAATNIYWVVGARYGSMAITGGAPGEADTTSQTTIEATTINATTVIVGP